MDNSTRLFGRYTKQDWLDLRVKILEDPNSINNWEKAINLLQERLETRHFRPIDKLLRMRITTGEGFAVMILICSLIEFLQGCYEGKAFKYRAVETKSVYGDSAKKFKDFLVQNEPFKTIFSKKVSKPLKRIYNFADDFYSHVRCGLLHEAATTNGWIIKTHRPTDASFEFIDLSDENRKIIYRDKFVEAIKGYCDNYMQQIIGNKKDTDKQFLRDNFCRKLDSLCLIENDALVKWWQ